MAAEMICLSVASALATIKERMTATKSVEPITIAAINACIYSHTRLICRCPAVIMSCSAVVVGAVFLSPTFGGSGAFADGLTTSAGASTFLMPDPSSVTAQC